MSVVKKPVRKKRRTSSSAADRKRRPPGAAPLGHGSQSSRSPKGGAPPEARLSKDDDEVRLQRFLAQCGIASRRHSEDIIRKGRVRVNGRVVTELGTKIRPGEDSVEVDGILVDQEQRVLFAFHKPVGMVSTMSDPEERPCIGDVVQASHHRLFPIGRLDYDVGGILLLTNDGDAAHALLHPRFGVPRRYIARVREAFGESTQERLTDGLRLDDGYAKADSVTILSREEAQVRFRHWRQTRGRFIELTVSEGRNHFVKRLLGACGLTVAELYRVSFGPYRLGSLRPGMMRQLRFIADSRELATPQRTTSRSR